MSVVNEEATNENNRMEAVESAPDLLDGVSDHIKAKLLDLMSKLDKVEEIVQSIDSAPIKELQANVSNENVLL